MPLDDPGSWLQGATAIKTMFDTFRSAVVLVKEANAVGGGSEQQKQAIDTVLATANSSAVIAEAQMAQAFGYQLCKCDFPPTIMKTVGYFNRTHDKQHQDGDPVFECPKCGYNNAGGWAFKRLDKKG